MRRILDTAYKAAGGIAALSILGICLIVSAQVMLNILARVGGAELVFYHPVLRRFRGLPSGNGIVHGDGLYIA